jgi:DNA-binding CsgD family transcriptional regulator
MSEEKSELEVLKKELAELKEKCFFLERVVHELPANIYISDLKEGVVWCNRTNEETLGYTLQEILEMGGMEYLYQIVHPEDRTIPDESINHYHSFDGAEYGGIFRAKHKNKKEYKWFTGWAKAFRKNPQGDVQDILCVDVDLSPRMNTEKQLVAALQENLKHKNKLLIKALRKRELEVLKLICQGMSSKLIADKLSISFHTVQSHRKNLQAKLGTGSVAELVSFARESGLG